MPRGSDVLFCRDRGGMREEKRQASQPGSPVSAYQALVKRPWQRGTNVVLTLGSAPPTLTAALPDPGLRSHGRFPRKGEALDGMECEGPARGCLSVAYEEEGVLTRCLPESDVHSL